MLWRTGHGARKLSETTLLRVNSRLFYHGWPVNVLVSAGSVDVWTNRGSYNVEFWIYLSLSLVLIETYVMIQNTRTFVAGFQHNKVHWEELDMLCLNMDVVTGKSRWKIQYCLVQVLKHLGYKIWNVTDPILLRVHLTFLRTIYFEHHTRSLEFFNQMTLINCKTIMSLGHSYLIFFNLVIPSGGSNEYRRPRGAVLLTSQVARCSVEGCRPYVWGVDCHCITHGWLYREDII